MLYAPPKEVCTIPTTKLCKQMFKMELPVGYFATWTKISCLPRATKKIGFNINTRRSNSSERFDAEQKRIFISAFITFLLLFFQKMCLVFVLIKFPKYNSWFTE